MYSSLQSCVRVEGGLTDFLNCPKGVRHVCVLSPTLFSIFINQLAQNINTSGHHGIQLLPGLMELFILLFADDITLISSTPYGLQHQLNVLRESCVSLKLEVNIDKTKIMVFRKGGFLGKKEQWSYNGVKLEVVNEYCYLGFKFTTMISHNLGTNHLVLKGKRAVFDICRLYQQLREMSKDIFFKVFDAKVQPILLYSSEIWGTSRLESIEKVHLMACKYFLGVPTRTPNKMIYSELGRYPLYINSFVRSIQYWFKLLQMDHNRLPKQAYLMLFNSDKNGKINWVSNIRNLLSMYGFYYVWLYQGVGSQTAFIKQFKLRLCDTFKQECEETIQNKERYLFYRSFKSNFNQEQYIVDIDIFCFRVALSHFRFGVLPIGSNMQRYSDEPNAMMCPKCKTKTEDEHHLIFDCPLYDDLRKRFINSPPLPVFMLLNTYSLDRYRSLGKYLHYAMLQRKKYCETIGYIMTTLSPLF